MLASRNRKTRRGDTLIEVTFAIGIFCVVTMTSMSLMNRSLNNAQSSLESIMARNAIDTQAEAIRFIYDSTVAQRGSGVGNDENYDEIWEAIESRAISPNASSDFLNNYAGSSCESLRNSLQGVRAFAIDVNNLDDGEDALKVNSNAKNELGVAATSPMLEYNNGTNNFNTARGIWVIVVDDGSSSVNLTKYFDFYIQTCWNAPGESSSTTLGTVFRLYNTKSTVAEALPGGNYIPNPCTIDPTSAGCTDPCTIDPTLPECPQGGLETPEISPQNFETSEYHAIFDGTVKKASSNGTISYGESFTIKNIHSITNSVAFTVNGHSYTAQKPSGINSIFPWSAILTMKCNGTTATFSVQSKGAF